MAFYIASYKFVDFESCPPQHILCICHVDCADSLADSVYRLFMEVSLSHTQTVEQLLSSYDLFYIFVLRVPIAQRTKQNPEFNMLMRMMTVLKGANPRFCYNLLNVPRTVSNTYAQVARAPTCANLVQHIGSLSRATYRVPRSTKGQLSCSVWLSLNSIYFSFFCG